MKATITFSVLIFSSLGSWIGALMDHGNYLGGWSILVGFVGGIAGVWIGYKAGQYFGN